MIDKKSLLFVYIVSLIISPLFPQVLSQHSPKQNKSIIKKTVKEEARKYREEGYLAQSKGDFQKALAFYQKAVELDPNYEEVYNDLGVLYESMGNIELAEKMYLRALDINSGYLPAYTNLAFLYEKKGDIRKARDCWKKRYEYGRPGEYWREKAKEHLQKLGLYPQVKKEILEKEAALLSAELVYKREQQRLKKNKEAELHFSLGINLFSRGNYEQALKELTTALSVDPPDKDLKEKIRKYITKVRIAFAKKQARASIKQALNYLESEDYLGCVEELHKSISMVSEIPLKRKK